MTERHVNDETGGEHLYLGLCPMLGFHVDKLFMKDNLTAGRERIAKVGEKTDLLKEGW